MSKMQNSKVTFIIWRPESLIDGFDCDVFVLIFMYDGQISLRQKNGAVNRKT